MSQNLRAAQKTFRTTRCWEKIYAQKHLEAQYVLHVSRFLTIYPRISILHFYQCRYTNHTYQFSTNVVFSMTSFDRSPGHNHPRVGYNHPGICRFCIHETMVLYVGLYVDMFKICTSNHDNMKTIENPWLHHFKEIRFFFFALFLSFFHRQTHRPTANSARSPWPSLPGRVEPSSFTSRSWRNCLLWYFFVVPEIYAVYWKIDFVNFLLGVIVFTSAFEGLVKTVGLSFI